MANLVHDIEEQTDNEEIEAVVIGEMGWGDYGSKAVPLYNEQPQGTVLEWKKAKPLLDYEFDNGYGAPGCNAVYAWTKSWVIFVATYDGSTWVTRIPRNPIDIMPDMPGGG